MADPAEGEAKVPDGAMSDAEMAGYENSPDAVPTTNDLIVQLAEGLDYDLPPGELVDMHSKALQTFLMQLGKMVCAHDEALRRPAWVSVMEERFKTVDDLVEDLALLEAKVSQVSAVANAKGGKTTRSRPQSPSTAQVPPAAQDGQQQTPSADQPLSIPASADAGPPSAKLVSRVDLEDRLLAVRKHLTLEIKKATLQDRSRLNDLTMEMERLTSIVEGAPSNADMQQLTDSMGVKHKHLQAYVGDKLMALKRDMDTREASSNTQLNNWKSEIENTTVDKIANMEQMVNDMADEFNEIRERTNRQMQEMEDAVEELKDSVSTTASRLTDQCRDCESRVLVLEKGQARTETKLDRIFEKLGQLERNGEKQQRENEKVLEQLETSIQDQQGQVEKCFTQLEQNEGKVVLMEERTQALETLTLEQESSANDHMEYVKSVEAIAEETKQGVGALKLSLAQAVGSLRRAEATAAEASRVAAWQGDDNVDMSTHAPMAMKVGALLWAKLSPEDQQKYGSIADMVELLGEEGLYEEMRVNEIDLEDEDKISIEQEMSAMSTGQHVRQKRIAQQQQMKELEQSNRDLELKLMNELPKKFKDHFNMIKKNEAASKQLEQTMVERFAGQDEAREQVQQSFQKEVVRLDERCDLADGQINDIHERINTNKEHILANKEKISEVHNLSVENSENISSTEANGADALTSAVDKTTSVFNDRLSLLKEELLRYCTDVQDDVAARFAETDGRSVALAPPNEQAKHLRKQAMMLADHCTRLEKVAEQRMSGPPDFDEKMSHEVSLVARDIADFVAERVEFDTIEMLLREPPEAGRYEDELGDKRRHQYVEDFMRLFLEEAEGRHPKPGVHRADARLKFRTKTQGAIESALTRYEQAALKHNSKLLARRLQVPRCMTCELPLVNHSKLRARLASQELSEARMGSVSLYQCSTTTPPYTLGGPLPTDEQSHASYSTQHSSIVPSIDLSAGRTRPSTSQASLGQRTPGSAPSPASRPSRTVLAPDRRANTAASTERRRKPHSESEDPQLSARRIAPDPVSGDFVMRSGFKMPRAPGGLSQLKHAMDPDRDPGAAYDPGSSRSPFEVRKW